jgi:hypothetical protein
VYFYLAGYVLFICFFFWFSFGLLGILDYEFLFFIFFAPLNIYIFFLCPLNIFLCILIKKILLGIQIYIFLMYMYNFFLLVNNFIFNFLCIV